MKKNQKGFSLIELLIVVVVIAVIAAIAIPNLIASRRAANESSAVSTVRMLHGAQVTHAATAGGGNYAGDLNTLSSKNLIDGSLATGIKSGYEFVSFQTLQVVNGAEATFTIGAKPTIASGISQTGTRKVCVATDGVIRSSSVPTGLANNITADNQCVAASYADVTQ
jgi:type IV pilus assembly protein PilA